MVLSISTTYNKRGRADFDEDKAEKRKRLTINNIFLKYPKTPLETAKFMAENCPSLFVKKAIQFLSPGVKDGTENNYKTNCILNLYGCGVLFSGQTEAIELYNQSNFSIDRYYEFSYENKSLKYFIRELFSGAILASFIHSTEEETNENSLDALTDLYASQFCDSQINPNINALLEEDSQIDIFNEVWKNCKYSFNSTTIEFLKNDIFSNRNKLDSENSFVYYLSISNNAFNRDFYHALTLEQFQDDNGEDKYRLYQTWQDQFKLLDYLEKEQVVMTFEEIQEFISDLNTLLTPGNEQEDLQAIQKKWFGYGPLLNPQSVFFMEDTKTLAGLTLRYFANQINPARAWDNFHSFMSL